MTKRKTARDRLASFLRRHPDAWQTHSLSDIARAIGVSREWVRVQLPGYAKGRTLRVAQFRLRSFLKEHRREAIAAGKRLMTFEALAETTGLGPATVATAWRSLGLPEERPRKSRREKNRDTYQRHKAKHYAASQSWKARHKERAKELQANADRRYKAKVLRTETCVACRKRFPWTVSREQRRRTRGTRIVCSTKCGIAAAMKERRAKEGRDGRRARREDLPAARLP
jgi:hypothetical protein